MRRSGRCFSLMEMLIVMAIISILAALVMVGVQSLIRSGNKTQAQEDLRALYTALEQYKMQYGEYPDTANFDASASAPRYFKFKSIPPVSADDSLVLTILQNAKMFNFNNSQIKEHDSKYKLCDPWGEPYIWVLADGKDDGTGGTDEVPDNIEEFSHPKVTFGTQKLFIFSTGGHYKEYDSDKTEDTPDYKNDLVYMKDE